MKVLITGASGFVGRNLVLRLHQDPSYDQLILPVRSRKKLEAQLIQEGVSLSDPKISILETGAPDWKGLEGLQIDHLVHCAGLLFAREREEFFETNVAGTLQLFRNVSFEKAVVLSSQAASGPCHSGQLVKTEEDTEHPITWYGRSKLEMENQLAKEFRERNYVCIRPPMILGARDSATLPLFKMVKGGLLFKPGFKPKYYSYVAVSDLVAAIERALQRPMNERGKQSKSYFVACNEIITDELLLTTAARAAEKRGVLVRIPQPILKWVAKAVDAVPAWRAAVPSLSGDRASEIWPERWVVSSKRFSEEFSWIAKGHLLQTLQETYSWYRKNGEI